ncbi:hypothetical protein E4U54_004520 [Claviceps lovelessii]|nr:hypothetical protein E4U54_004520 [Claviceps lovelessii]
MAAPQAAPGKALIPAAAVTAVVVMAGAPTTVDCESVDTGGVTSELEPEDDESVGWGASVDGVESWGRLGRAPAVSVTVFVSMGAAEVAEAEAEAGGPAADVMTEAWHWVLTTRVQ